MAAQFGKKEWVELFQQAGLSEEMMDRWHRLFETQYPESHSSFLQWLKLPEQEITAIRQRFR